MEQNRVLDTFYSVRSTFIIKTTLVCKGISINRIVEKARDINHLSLNTFISFSLCIVLFCSCAFPRILVLDDPLSPEEHINLGLAYETKGDLENALKEYNKASKKLPLAFLYIGNTYYNKGDFVSAEAYYKKTITYDPNISDAYNNLAWLYYIKEENLDEAETLVLKAIELNPQKKDIYLDTLEKIRIINIREK